MSAISGIWTVDGLPSPKVVEYAKPILARAAREGKTSVLIYGFRWTFTHVQQVSAPAARTSEATR